MKNRFNPYELFDEQRKIEQRRIERAEELAHERELAAIRAQPHALVLASQTSAPAPVESSNLNPRQAFVFPLLAKEGWSILDWANAARVSSATAHDFLRNRTNPYRSTRLKLAKSLGVSIQQLPR
jgi:lambda repressor-like predicted transcriptional regulator